MEVLAEKKPIEEQVDCNIDINISSANRVNYHFNKGFGLFVFIEQLSCNQDFYIDKEELICITVPSYVTYRTEEDAIYITSELYRNTVG